MKKILRSFSAKVKRIPLKDRILLQKSENEVDLKSLKIGISENASSPAEKEGDLQKKSPYSKDLGNAQFKIGSAEERERTHSSYKKNSAVNADLGLSSSTDKSSISTRTSKTGSLGLGMNNTAPTSSINRSKLIKPKQKSSLEISDLMISASKSDNTIDSSKMNERRPFKSGRKSLAERQPKTSLDFDFSTKETGNFRKKSIDSSDLPKQQSSFTPNTKEVLKAFYAKKPEIDLDEKYHESSANSRQSHIPGQTPYKTKSRTGKIKDAKHEPIGFEPILPVQKEDDVFSLEGLEEVDLVDSSTMQDSEKSAYASKKFGKERERERKEKIKKKKEAKFEAKQQLASKPKAAKVKNIAIHDGITVANLSVLLDVTLRQFQFQLVKAGFEEYPADYMLTAEIASMMVLEYNMNPILTTVDTVDLSHRPPPSDWSQFPLRPPVITIMGHVDHGKTTLLDSLRKTSVAAGEAGGITQHIGAFSVELPSGKKITFLDTPGHAAFSHMRKRGAQVTDVVVLVVAADDGVMPQTIEAIKHSIEARVPIIVAVNKCDKPGVDPLKIKQDLLRYDIVVEELGGEVPAIHVSGKTGMGLAELEETILAIAEISDYRGDPSGPVEAVVVESQQTPQLGNVATVIVKRGILSPGAILVAGNSWCKVKKMVDEYGRELTNVLPSNPVEVLGWKDLPNAGDHVLQAQNETLAKRVVANRMRKKEIQSAMESIEDINEKRGIARGKYELARAEAKKMNRRFRVRGAQNEEKTIIDENVLRIVLKADVYGSVEAIEGALGALPSHEVRCEVLSTGVGAVTESDIEYAKATGAYIFAFNVPVSRGIQTIADDIKVTISQHNIIYTLIDKAKEELSKLLKPDIVTEILGDAIVQEVFEISSKKKSASNIAGCKILSGKLTRQGLLRVIRNDEIIYEGNMKTFKHHKKDILEASKGLECGIAIENFDGIQKGDHIVAISVTEKARFI